MSGLESAVEELGTICAELRGKLVRSEQSNIELNCRLQGLTEERAALLREAEAHSAERLKYCDAAVRLNHVEMALSGEAAGIAEPISWECRKVMALEAAAEKERRAFDALDKRFHEQAAELAAANAKAAELCAGYNNRTHEIEKLDGQLEAAEQHIKVLQSQLTERSLTSADARELEARRALDIRQAKGSLKFGTSTSGMALIADEDLLLVPIAGDFGAAYIKIAEDLDLLRPEPLVDGSYTAAFNRIADEAYGEIHEHDLAEKTVDLQMVERGLDL